MANDLPGRNPCSSIKNKLFLLRWAGILVFDNVLKKFLRDANDVHGLITSERGTIS